MSKLKLKFGYYVYSWYTVWHIVCNLGGILTWRTVGTLFNKLTTGFLLNVHSWALRLSLLLTLSQFCYMLLLYLLLDCNLRGFHLLCLSHVPPPEDSFAGQIEAHTKDHEKIKAHECEAYTHICKANFVSGFSIWDEISQTHQQGEEDQDYTLVGCLHSA